MEDQNKSSPQSSIDSSLDKSQSAFQKDPQARRSAIMERLLFISISINAVLFYSYRSEVADNKALSKEHKKEMKESNDFVVGILIQAVDTRNTYKVATDSLKMEAKILSQ